MGYERNHPALSTMMDNTNEPYPRYNRCANCTKLLPKMNQCSRCKIVKYCSRECQSLHWKKVHKHSCTKAQVLPLYKILNGNDGFYMSPHECQKLHEALTNDEFVQSDDVIRCFQAYFDVVADLGGCFVLWYSLYYPSDAGYLVWTNASLIKISSIFNLIISNLCIETKMPCDSVMERQGHLLIFSLETATL